MSLCHPLWRPVYHISLACFSLIMLHISPAMLALIILGPFAHSLFHVLFGAKEFETFRIFCFQGTLSWESTLIIRKTSAEKLFPGNFPIRKSLGNSLGKTVPLQLSFWSQSLCRGLKNPKCFEFFGTAAEGLFPSGFPRESTDRGVQCGLAQLARPSNTTQLRNVRKIKPPQTNNGLFVHGIQWRSKKNEISKKKHGMSRKTNQIWKVAEREREREGVLEKSHVLKDWGSRLGVCLAPCVHALLWLLFFSLPHPFPSLDIHRRRVLTKSGRDKLFPVRHCHELPHKVITCSHELPHKVITCSHELPHMFSRNPSQSHHMFSRTSSQSLSRLNCAEWIRDWDMYLLCLHVYGYLRMCMHIYACE